MFNRKKTPKPVVARIVCDADDRSQDLPMWLGDALALHAQGKLQKCFLDSPAYEPAFTMPRSWRQITKGLMFQPQGDVAILISKAQNAGARFHDCHSAL